MGKDVSIVYKGIDQLTGVTNSIRNANKGLNKDMEESSRLAQDYRKRQEEISRQMAKTQTAMVASTEEVKKAKRAYAELGDETRKTNLEKAITSHNNLTSTLREQKQMAYDTAREMRELNGQQRKSENAAGGGSMMGQLAKAGLAQMAGQALAGAANTFVGSALGSEAGTMFSEVLSGVASGAAMGSLAGPIGAAIGGAVGGITGAIGGGTQVFQQRDDAFKGYVQGQYDGMRQRRGEQLTAGSGIAGGREQDAIAFNTMLGNGVGDKYLTDLRTLAAKTPMEYGDLTTMSRSLATGFKEDPSRMLSLMGSIGDAGSAVGIDASGMAEMAKAMSNIQSSGKTSLEYLKIFQERGVDVIGMLSDGLGKSKAQIYDMISKGKIDGVEAVHIIQDAMDEMYGGAMERQSQTFGGLSSTLADAQKEMQNAYGIGYNETRGGGIEKEIAAYGGSLGDAVARANEAIGKGMAFTENMAERHQREAMSALFEGAAPTLAGLQGGQGDRLSTMHDQYTKLIEASERGDSSAGIQIQKLKDEAEGMAKSAYDVSETGMKVHDAEQGLITAIQANTAAVQAWKPGYDLSISMSKGQKSMKRQSDRETIEALYGDGNAMQEAYGTSAGDFSSADPEAYTKRQLELFRGGAAASAFGLRRVPKDNYPALLHRDERVLTANQARQQDSGGGTGGVVVNMYGTSVREEADVGKIAKAMVAEVIKARTLSVG